MCPTYVDCMSWGKIYTGCSLNIVFFRIFKNISNSGLSLFSLGVSVCTHTRQVENQRCNRTGRVQKNHFKEKTQYLMNTLYINSSWAMSFSHTIKGRSVTQRSGRVQKNKKIKENPLYLKTLYISIWMHGIEETHNRIMVYYLF